MVGKDLVMATLFGGSGSSGSGGGGVWMQTGTLVFETDMGVSSPGWGIPVDDSNGAPEVIYFCKEVAETSNSIQDGDVLSVIAAPKLLSGIYTVGRPRYSSNYMLPYVASNESAIYKHSDGLYYPCTLSSMLNTKLFAGATYRWIAIGGLPE